MFLVKVITGFNSLSKTHIGIGRCRGMQILDGLMKRQGLLQERIKLMSHQLDFFQG